MLRALCRADIRQGKQRHTLFVARESTRTHNLHVSFRTFYHPDYNCRLWPLTRSTFSAVWLIRVAGLMRFASYRPVGNFALPRKFH